MIDFIFSFTFSIIFWVFFLPPVLVLSTPAILVASAFGKEKYLINMKKNYLGIFKWWRKFVSFM